MKKWIFAALLMSTMPLAAELKVLAISGSTRNDSFNKKILKEAVELAKAKGASVTVIDLKDYAMPFYDGDIEAKSGLPAQAKRLRDLMVQSNAIIIATPEYNGSVSAVLKNAIDWTTRNEAGQPSRDAYKGKKFAIMSVSPGKGGGARALGHLRTIIENLGGEVVQVQVALPDAYGAFDAEGKLKGEKARQDLQQEIDELLK